MEVVGKWGLSCMKFGRIIVLRRAIGGCIYVGFGFLGNEVGNLLAYLVTELDFVLFYSSGNVISNVR